MTKLSERLKNRSINSLKNFISKSRKRKLSKNKLNLIKNLIKEKEKYNKLLAKKIINSPLAKLAKIKIIAQKKININKKINASDLLLTMWQIIIEAEKSKPKYKKLKEYIEDYND